MQTYSVERALEIVEWQNRGRDCEVPFPIDPEAFFVAEPPRRRGRQSWGGRRFELADLGLRVARSAMRRSKMIMFSNNYVGFTTP